MSYSSMAIVTVVVALFVEHDGSVNPWPLAMIILLALAILNLRKQFRSR